MNNAITQYFLHYRLVMPVYKILKLNILLYTDLCCYHVIIHIGLLTVQYYLTVIKDVMITISYSLC